MAYTHRDTPPDENPHLPALGSLEDFVNDSEFTDGVAIDDLERGAIVSVHTQNSCYRFEVLDNRTHRARVVGGWFHEPTQVGIEGSTAGGSVIRAGWVGVGLRLELSLGLRRITTSAVTHVAVEDHDSNVR
jgi:hypothetical protein